MKLVQLYSMAICPFAQRTKIVLAHKNVPHEVTELDISKPMPEWFKELNPEERVPVIRHEGRILNESSVINEYLEDVFPEPRLFPLDAYKRALSRAWITWCNDTFVPAMYTLLMNQNRAKDQELTRDALGTFAQLNQWLMQHNPDGTYAWDKFGMVDLSFAPFFQRYCLNEHYRGFRIPESKEYQRVRRWIGALIAHPVVTMTGMSDERYIKYYYDYSLGYGDGEIPPGREKSSFALD